MNYNLITDFHSIYSFNLTKCGGSNDDGRTGKIRLTRDPERKAVVAEVFIKTREAFEVPCPDLRQKGGEIKECLT